MRGTTLIFKKPLQTARDAFNNPVNETVDIEIADCLIAPIGAPSNAREQQAMQQSRDQVYIHLPKTFDGDISGSDVVWYGKLFHIDSDSVMFMPENTPTRWNRYFRGEFVRNYATHEQLTGEIITEDDLFYLITENSKYYFAQEMVI